MVNVHAGGGERMMLASRRILEPYIESSITYQLLPMITSMEQSDLAGIGFEHSTTKSR